MPVTGTTILAIPQGDYTTQMLPPMNGFVSHTEGSLPNGPYTWADFGSTPPTRVDFKVTGNSTSTSNVYGGALVILDAIPASRIQNFNATCSGPTTTTPFWNPPSWARYFGFAGYDQDSANHTATVELTFGCPGQTTGQPAAPCCPPDPAIEQQLDQILGLLKSVYQSLPVPLHSYADGLVTPIAGSGEFAVQASTIAFRVDVTSTPPGIGWKAGDPNFYAGLGWLTTSTTGSNYSSLRLTYGSQIFVLPALADTIHYTLEYGVAATVTELSRGP